MNDPVHPEEAIFEAASALPASDRAGYLDRTCGGKAGLRELVGALLEAHDEAPGFLEQPAPGVELSPAAGPRSPPAGSETTASSIEKPGDRIGRYKLLQQIGEGGCGVVYMAEQEEPVRRKVALKIIKLGMDTKTVTARFEAERQALAVMDHPHIAKVFDAGATETGRPYFVMELVRGVRITQFCNERQLSLHERLDLFVQVCRAIQHAHQKGLIHRDIKPSNILVTLNDNVPVPKVIDFGIAKATAGRLTEQTLFTRFEQFLGTPAYMSPEQAEAGGVDIDTRSDIYSLGVVLYELLTGRTPFDSAALLKQGIEELILTLRDVEPPRPSTRLAGLAPADLETVARSQRCEAPMLVTSLRGDLDWIMMKCLEKDRTRRYATANGLAMDVQRYLDDEPVLARPPSNIYRLQKLVRRNKLAFTAIVTLIGSLIIGLGLCTWLLIEERKARLRAVAAENATEHARLSEVSLRQQAQTREQLLAACILMEEGQFRAADNLLGTLSTAFIKDTPAVATTEALIGELSTRCAEHGDWTDVATLYSAKIKINQMRDFDYFCYGPLLIELGDTAGYERLRQTLPALFGDTTNQPAAIMVAKICLLRPADAKMLAAMDSVARVLAQPWPEKTDPNRSAITLALIAYRRGQYASTVEWCGKVDPVIPLRSLTAHVLRAMAYHQLTRHDEAQAELVRCEGVIERTAKNKLSYGDTIHGQWPDWFIAHILVREARAMMSGKTSPQMEAVLHEEADARAKIAQALTLCKQGKYEEAEKLIAEPAFKFSQESLGGSESLLRSLGAWHREHGRFEKVATLYSELLKVDPTRASDYVEFASVLAGLGDTTSYEQLRKAAIARFGDTTDPATALCIAKAGLLLPADASSMESLTNLMNVALTAPIPEVGWLWTYSARLLLDYRLGNYLKTVEESRNALADSRTNSAKKATAHLLLAMAYQRLSRPDEARKELANNRHLIETAGKNEHDFGDSGQDGPWWDWLCADALLREAITLIGADPSPLSQPK